MTCPETSHQGAVKITHQPIPTPFQGQLSNIKLGTIWPTILNQTTNLVITELYFLNNIPFGPIYSHTLLPWLPTVGATQSENTFPYMCYILNSVHMDDCDRFTTVTPVDSVDCRYFVASAMYID